MFDHASPSEQAETLRHGLGVLAYLDRVEGDRARYRTPDWPGPLAHLPEPDPEGES